MRSSCWKNISRHIEAGEKPMAAAFKGSRKWVSPCLSMNLSLVAVFMSILFMGGIVGSLLRRVRRDPERWRS